MTVTTDDSPAFSDFAHPEALVSTEWLAEHLDEPGLVVVESDEDVLLYETGHIRGAVKVDWHTELNDPVVRDYVEGERFAELLGSKGISREDTVVIYGDKNNWWAAYALWVFRLFGHPDVRLLDGGRAAWESEGREYTTDAPGRTAVSYPVIPRDDSALRAFKDDVLYPEEGALRAGHVTTAQNVPWARAVGENGRFRSRWDLEEIYDDVRNYDGSWTEWGSAVRVPIATGTQPGAVPTP